MSLIIKNLTTIFQKITINKAAIHTSACLNGNWNKHNHGPRKWTEYNKKIFPPQILTGAGEEDEKPRPAFVCHMKNNIKYSPYKMWYIASFIRGMTVDEALKQLSFVLKKGGVDVRETVLEAQEMAVKSHNVEFKSNLWIGELKFFFSMEFFLKF